VRVGVRVNDASALAGLEARFPPGWKTASSSVVERLYSLRVGRAGSRPGLRHYHMLYEGAGRLARSLNLEDVLETFESDLHLHVAELARRRVFVHAGVVGWRGKAILIPGRSFSGKTTLVIELLRAGATFYSDEYAVLDERGRVHPFARPLGVREDDTPKQTKYRAEQMGAEAGERPLPVSLVIMSRYKPGARWRPRALTLGQGALALLENTVSARRQPQIALATLQKAVETATIIKGVRGEAGEVADSVLKLI
jgi:hypothetical protein